MFKVVIFYSENKFRDHLVSIRIAWPTDDFKLVSYDLCIVHPTAGCFDALKSTENSISWLIDI